LLPAQQYTLARLDSYSGHKMHHHHHRRLAALLFWIMGKTIENLARSVSRRNFAKDMRREKIVLCGFNSFMSVCANQLAAKSRRNSMWAKRERRSSPLIMEGLGLLFTSHGLKVEMARMALLATLPLVPGTHNVIHFSSLFYVT
jgi:hypothetical protein